MKPGKIMRVPSISDVVASLAFAQISLRLKQGDDHHHRHDHHDRHHDHHHCHLSNPGDGRIIIGFATPIPSGGKYFSDKSHNDCENSADNDGK